MRRSARKAKIIGIAGLILVVPFMVVFRFVASFMLDITLYNSNRPLSKLLVAVGANINQRDDRWTPLLSAIESNSIKRIALCLELGADPNMGYGRSDNGVDNEVIEGCTPLYSSFGDAPYEATLLLVQYGADVNKPCKNGETPLKLAKKLKNTRVMRLLLEHGAHD